MEPNKTARKENENSSDQGEVNEATEAPKVEEDNTEQTIETKSQRKATSKETQPGAVAVASGLRVGTISTDEEAMVDRKVAANNYTASIPSQPSALDADDTNQNNKGRIGNRDQVGFEREQEMKQEGVMDDSKLGTVASIPIEDNDATQQQTDLQTADTAEMEGSVPIIHAELVAPPVEAYRVSIDEDIPAARQMIEFSSLEIEPYDENKGRKMTKVCIAFSGLVILFVALVCAIAIPLSRQNSNDLINFDDIYPFQCYTSTEDILNAQRFDENLPEAYIICPNTQIAVGTFSDPAVNDFSFVNGDYPIFIIRENVVIQCGLDGKRENNCTLDGGFIQVMTLQSVPTNDGGFKLNNSIDNWIIRGITFSGQPSGPLPFSGNSVTLSHPGKNLRFEDCVWKDFSAQAGLIAAYRNLFQILSDLPLEDNSIEVTFSDCTFEGIVYDKPLIRVDRQAVTLERCRFRDIVLSSLLQQDCIETDLRWDNYTGGCAVLMYCHESTTCFMRDVCVEDFEYWGPSVIYMTDSTEFGFSNLYLDTAEFEECEFGLGGVDGTIEPDCISVFNEPTCTIRP